MNNEQQFYQELERTPEVPETLYDGIRHRIRRGVVIERSLISLAVCVVLITGSVLFINKPFSSGNGIDPEVAYELQIIHDYLNGDDLASGTGEYAEVMGELALLQQEE